MKVHITSCSIINLIRQILVYFSKENIVKVTQFQWRGGISRYQKLELHSRFVLFRQIILFCKRDNADCQNYLKKNTSLVIYIYIIWSKPTDMSSNGRFLIHCLFPT